MSLVRQIAKWWRRRRRFAEEWAFHRDMAISELGSLGMSPREARRLARRRLGSFRRYRRAAVRELRTDGSNRIYRFKRGPFFLPAAVAILIVLILAFDPQRLQAIQSISRLLPFTSAREIDRFVPLTPPGIVPTGFAAAILWPFAGIGIAALGMALRRSAHWRAWTYGTAMLLLLMLLAGVCWAAGLQLLLKNRWPGDAIQGFAIIGFWFAWVGSMFAGLRFLLFDLMRRCPVCLRCLGLAETRGNAHDLLVAPHETETVCLQGHGLSVESRWGRFFAPPADLFPL